MSHIAKDAASIAAAETRAGKPTTVCEPHTKRRPRIKTAFVRSPRPGMPNMVGPEDEDAQAWVSDISDAFGTPSSDFAMAELGRLIGALKDAEGNLEERELNAVLAAVDGAEAKDEFEAMLASQMAITHAMAMDFLGRAKRATMVESLQAGSNIAVKLLRTFAMQAEAMAKLRRGGEQLVRVEHVHVYPGGQAIVGSVTNQAPSKEGGQQ